MWYLPVVATVTVKQAGYEMESMVLAAIDKDDGLVKWAGEGWSFEILESYAMCVM